MNLTWHVARKDIVLLRYSLVPWLGMTVVQVFLSARLLSPASAYWNRFEQTGMYFNLAAGISLVLTFFLAAMLVREDPLDGPDAFWVTRPISGARLLSAKMLTALLMLGLPPLLIWMPWWIHCGYGASDLAIASLRILGWQTAAIFPAFVLGSQVSHAGRFVLVTAALSTALFVVVLTVSVSGFVQTVTAELLASRLLLALVFIVVAGSVAVGWRYVNRGNLWPTVILGVGALSAAALVAGGPWDIFAARRAWLWRSAGGEGITARIEGLHDAMRSNGNDTAAFVLDLDLTLSGLPDDLVAGQGWADVEFRWPDGEVVRQRQRAIHTFADRMPIRLALGLPARDSWQKSWDPETDAWLMTHESSRGPHQDDVVRGNELHRASGEIRHDVVRIALELSREEMDRMNAAPPACRVVIHGILQKPEVLLAQSLDAGRTMAGDGVRVLLAGITPFTIQRPARKNATQGVLMAAEATSAGAVDCYWVDPKRGLAWRLGSPWSSITIPFSMQFGTLYFNRFTPQLMRDGKWIDETEDRSQSRLVAVGSRFDRRFECTVDTPRVAIEPAAKSVIAGLLGDSSP